MITQPNTPSFLITALGLLGALFTSRQSVVRLLHRPLLVGLVTFGVLPALQTRGYSVNFAVVIGAAFGIGLSLDDGRAPQSLLLNPRRHFLFPLLLGVDWWRFGDGGRKT
jgi:hypothetical protein